MSNRAWWSSAVAVACAVGCVPNVVGKSSGSTTAGSSASSGSSTAAGSSASSGSSTAAGSSASSTGGGGGGTTTSGTGSGGSATTTSGTGGGLADGGPEDAPAGAPCDGSTAGILGFTPSNFSLADFALAGVDLCDLGDAVIQTDGCHFDTMDDVQTCTTATVRQIVVSQAAGADLAIWIARSWSIYPGVTVTVTPTRPVVFVALDTIDIEGTLSVSASGYGPSAGGYPYLQPGMPNLPGNGPGGGGAGSTNNAGAGGGLCGQGGTGAAWPGGVAAHGGTYPGNPALIPLVGGSSGGGGVGYPGSGGGAIQLVAALSVTVGVPGVVEAGGGGGGGGNAQWMADGGGSGGAILIEALSVNTPGTLSANGGGGGGEPPATNAGGSATGSAIAAPGGGTEGGQGSAALITPGSPGLCPGPSCGQSGVRAGGGGGGAGRIRINTGPGNVQFGGVKSPATNSTCYSEGKLMP